MAARLAAALAVLAAAPAHASFLPPEMMDTAAMGLAWFVICVVPIGGIVLFWMVHVLPEKIAHKRHHPQRMPSTRYACCRWRSAACCGRWHGCGRT